MTKYELLSYTVPPVNQGQIVEVAYAVTPDEVVRRTFDKSDRSVSYETADLCEMSGEFEPWNRVPSVSRGAWTPVDASNETPE